MEPYTEVYTWGSNDFGQMGLESSPTSCTIPRFCSFSIIIQQVSCGYEHSALLSSQHYVYTMGSNADGRLGIGDKTLVNSSYPLLVETLNGVKVTQISCGGFHSAAVTHEGNVFTWGKGTMLGLGDLITKWVPCKLDLDLTFVIQVSCGENHSGLVCIKNKEKICLTWGTGSSGQLGQNTRESADRPGRALVSDIKDVACGSDFTLFLTNGGQVLSCGKNTHGELGHNNTLDLSTPKIVKSLSSFFITKIAASNLAACLSEEGTLFVWGDSNLTPKQVRGCPKDIKEVSLGHNFFAVLTQTSSLWTMGDNKTGQLGVGEASDKGLYLVESLKKKKVKQVSCGKDFVLALGEDVDDSESKKNPQETFRKKNRKTNREQFWSSERNEDENLYESALKKMNDLLIQKEKELETEKEIRGKNQDFIERYYELEEKYVEIIKKFEAERVKREETEAIHSRNEAKLLRIIRDKESEISKLKDEIQELRQGVEPCSFCVNILNEFQALKVKNESVLIEISKKTPQKPGFSIDGSGLQQSPSFDKSLDKSIDRHLMVSNQMRVSRSESELLKLIDDKNSERNEAKLPLLKLDFENKEEFALPTFRGQENSFSMQKNLKNSIADIRARINILNSNRSELQNKMEELESKLVKSTQRYYGKEDYGYDEY